mmetsp:Transcript_11131/g.16803  ORF Transcript_11131/g.16803 Transcript_11131/m.16803 type:complete len:221 (-) Transcript_11131:51-713(-)
MLYLLLTIDSSAETHQRFQKTLIDAVFEKIPPTELVEFSLHIPFTDTNISVQKPMLDFPSRFRRARLLFHRQKLRELRLFQWLFTNSLEIDFLPPCVKTLSIVSSMQEFELHCRRLPRDAEVVQLCGNLIVGTLDLQSLPVSLVQFDVHKNRLSGGYSLVDLPEKLEVLNLFELQGLNQEIVLYRNIPEKLRHIRLTNAREVRPTATQYKVKDNSIFYLE